MNYFEKRRLKRDIKQLTEDELLLKIEETRNLLEEREKEKERLREDLEARNLEYEAIRAEKTGLLAEARDEEAALLNRKKELIVKEEEKLKKQQEFLRKNETEKREMVRQMADALEEDTALLRKRKEDLGAQFENRKEEYGKLKEEILHEEGLRKKEIEERFEREWETMATLTKEELAEKRRQLQELLERVRDQEAEHISVKKDLEAKQEDAMRRTHELSGRFDEMIRASRSSAGLLSSEIEEREKNLAALVEEQEAVFARALGDLKTLKDSLEERLSARKRDQESERERLAARLKEREEEYAALKEKSFEEKRDSGRDLVAGIVRSKNEEKEELLKKQEALLMELGLVKDEEGVRYERALEGKKRTQKELEDLEMGYEERVRQFNDDLAALFAKCAADENEKTKQLEEAFENRRREWTLEKAGLDQELDTVQSRVRSLEDTIVRSREELSAFTAQKKLEEDEEIRKNDEALREEEARKHRFEEQIALLDEKKESIVREYEVRLNDVAQRKQEAEEDFRRRNEELDRSVEETYTALRTGHEDTLRSIEEGFLARMKDLNDAFDQQSRELEAGFEQEKAELEQKGEALKAQMEEIRLDTDRKVASLNEETNGILAAIERVKNDYEAEREALTVRQNTMEEDYRNRLSSLDEEHGRRMGEIVFDTLPYAALNAARALLDSLRGEYDSLVEESRTKREALELEEKERMSQTEARKAEALELLKQKEEALAAKDEETRALEAELMEKKNEQEAALEAEKKDFDERLETMRRTHEEETANLEQSFREEYERIREDHASREEEARKNYEEELSQLRHDYEAKRNAIAMALSEMDAKKALLIEQCKARYEGELAKTERLRSDFEALGAQNELERQRLGGILEERKEAISRDLTLVRNEGERKLEEKRALYRDTLDNLEREKEALREETVRLEAEIGKEKDLIAVYTGEKQASLDAYTGEADRFLQDVEDKMTAIAEKEAKLLEEHEKRVTELKNSIAASISEYDELLQLKPQIVHTTLEEGEKELLDKAKAFRERIDTLEASHDAMLEDLSKAREKTIEELTKELDEINAKKEERGNGEEELASIASAYDVLFAEERAKHEELKKQLLQRHDETQDILKERKNALDVLDSGYEEEKRSLLKSFDDKEKELTDESEEAERQLEEEKKTLEEKRASLSDTIRSLRERYRQIDKEIENEKLSLRNSYRDKVHEISKLYQNALEEQRTRLSRYDVMNDADNDLFKSDGD